MLNKLFVSQVRVAIIKLFLLNPGLRLHIRAICREIQAEINAVRRELQNLTKIKFLREEKSGNRVFYQVREDFIFFDELLGMVIKSEGLGGEVIKKANRLGKVDFAFISKEFAKGRRATPSDIDLFLVGKINLRQLEELVKAEERRRNREINYTVFTPEEFDFRRRRRDPFLVAVLKQPKIVLVGDENRYLDI